MAGRRPSQPESAPASVAEEPFTLSGKDKSRTATQPPGRAAVAAAADQPAAAAVASVRAFECEFVRVCWFGDDVVWLAPEPAGPFRALANMVHAAFPQFPPFGGVHADVVPHPTVGNGPDGGSAALHATAAEVTPLLPIRTQVRHAWLMTGTQALASWRVVAELPLGT